jgi:putative ABC transport system permease protein
LLALAALLFAPQHTIADQGQAPVPGVAIERRMAEKLGLAPGDTIVLSSDPGADQGRRFLVSAVYEARADPATVLRGEYYVRLHLPDLAAMLGRPDRVDRFGILTQPGASADSVSRLVNAAAFGYRAYPSAEIAAGSSQTFLVVSRFHRAIGVISVVASAIFLLCIMLLKVEERRLDTAVMRLVGISRRTVFKAVVLEACLVAALGSALGIGLAWVAGVATNAFYQYRFDTSLVFSYLTGDVILLSVSLSLGLGVVVGALAAGRLVQTHPLTLWRRRP